jgi:hypothetical protein
MWHGAPRRIDSRSKHNGIDVARIIDSLKAALISRGSTCSPIAAIFMFALSPPGNPLPPRTILGREPRTLHTCFGELAQGQHADQRIPGNP